MTRRVYGIIPDRDGNFYAVRTNGKRKLSLPGGRTRDYESRPRALGRELWEELRVKMLSYEPFLHIEKGEDTIDIYLVEIAGKPKASNEADYVQKINTRMRVQIRNALRAAWSEIREEDL